MVDFDRRLAATPLGRYLLFLRPRQWPILTCQLAVGVLLAPAVPRHIGAALGEPGPDWPVLAAAWVAWVLCLNGGTLALNSAYDRDTEDIAYLRRPPEPPRGLAPASLALMLAGVAIGFGVSRGFALTTAACVALSLLYSHPATRWKGIPGIDLAVNMVGYGGCTTLAGLSAGQAAWHGAAPPAAGGGWALVTAFALLFGSFYPLSQIYQVAADGQRGDRTFARSVGPRAALAVALALGLAAVPLFLLAVSRWPGTAAARRTPWLLACALAAWCAHIWRWRAAAGRRERADHERGMYRALAFWAAVDAALLAHRFAGW